jgi:hypothetical protein
MTPFTKWVLNGVAKFVTVCSETFPQKRVSGMQLRVFLKKKLIVIWFNPNQRSHGHCEKDIIRSLRIVLGSNRASNRTRSERRVET